jgi:hypothetical protein
MSVICGDKAYNVHLQAWQTGNKGKSAVLMISGAGGKIA